MSTWGYASYETDAVMNYLDEFDDDSESYIQDALNELKEEKAKFVVDHEYDRIHLGIVVYGVKHQDSVSLDDINQALHTANDLLMDEAYINCFSNRQWRRDVLKEEINLLKKTLN